ncbi:hypothetical protein CQW23_24273 [Capsicum baccatum]|uniref:Uncharacterized protein n=1 Tax=Capsicum baccatum TaxID=33114 RepID=A0A2G2VUF2_CAPBA|nr:hypothetical protein CQW23_24273 [Capsicum baccatum]
METGSLEVEFEAGDDDDQVPANDMGLGRYRWGLRNVVAVKAEVALFIYEDLLKYQRRTGSQARTSGRMLGLLRWKREPKGRHYGPTTRKAKLCRLGQFAYRMPMTIFHKICKGEREARLSKLYKAYHYISRWRRKLEELPFIHYSAKVPGLRVSLCFLKNPAPIGIRPGRPFLSAGASWVLSRSPIRCLDVSYTPRGAKRAYGLALPFDLFSHVTRNAQ